MKKNTYYFTKTPCFKPTFNKTNYTKEQQRISTLTILIFNTHKSHKMNLKN